MIHRSKLLFVFILIALMVAACGGSKATPTATPDSDRTDEVDVSEPSSSETATSETVNEEAEPVEATEIPAEETPAPSVGGSLSGEAPEILLNAIDSLNALESYHYDLVLDLSVVEGEVTTEFPFRFAGDYQSPNRTQAHMMISFLGVAQEADIVSVGEDTYMTNVDTGRWEVSSGNQFLLPSGTIGSLEEYVLNPEEIRELTLVQEEEIDGQAVYNLSGIIDVEALYDEQMGLEGEFAVNYWIGTQDHQVLKVAYAGVMMAAGLDGGVDTTIELSVSAIDEPVTISLPELPPPPTPAPPPQSLAEFCQENPNSCISKGSEDATVTLVEVSDYGCGHCKNFNLGTAGLIDEAFVETGQIRYVVIPFALWPETALAPVAAVCAGEQDSFWEYHRLLFERQSDPAAFTDQWVLSAAEELELDMTVFDTCLDSSAVQEIVQQNILAVQLAGVNSTPTFYVGESLLVGNQPFSEFATTIAAELDLASE